MRAAPYRYQPPNTALLAAFGSSEADIAVNRQGGLSPAQLRALWRERLPSLCLALGGCGLLFLVWQSFQRNQVDATSTALVAALLLLGLLGSLFLSARAWRQLRALRAQTTAGIAQLEERGGRYGGWFLYVDGRAFELTARQFYALRSGMALAVYSAGPGKRLLAVEEIVFSETKGWPLQRFGEENNSHRDTEVSPS